MLIDEKQAGKAANNTESTEWDTVGRSLGCRAPQKARNSSQRVPASRKHACFELFDIAIQPSLRIVADVLYKLISGCMQWHRTNRLAVKGHYFICKDQYILSSSIFNVMQRDEEMRRIKSRDLDAFDVDKLNITARLWFVEIRGFYWDSCIFVWPSGRLHCRFASLLGSSVDRWFAIFIAIKATTTSHWKQQSKENFKTFEASLFMRTLSGGAWRLPWREDWFWWTCILSFNRITKSITKWRVS